MVLLADYEGLGVAIAQMFWMILTLPAAALAIVGLVLAKLHDPWRKTAIGLGIAGGLLAALGTVSVWLAFQDERARLGSFAERFRPSPAVWIATGMVLLVAAAAVAISLLRRSKPRGDQTSRRDPQRLTDDQDRHI